MSDAERASDLDAAAGYARTADKRVARLVHDVDGLRSTVATGDVDASLIALGRVGYLVDRLVEDVGGVREHLSAAREG